MYVCLWSPVWSIDGASVAEAPESGTEAEEEGQRSAEVAPLLADLAPRIRVDRTVVWADGRGLDAERLALRLVARAEELGLSARAGVASVPVTAMLAARWGPRDDPSGAPTPFLVKERTGWGWRRSTPPPAPTPLPPPRGGTTARPRSPGDPHSTHPPRLGDAGEGRTPTSPTSGVEVGRGSPTSGGGAGKGRVVVVEEGKERVWMAGLPVSALEPTGRVVTLLEGMGIGTVGELASLEREAVEVRLGGAVVELWRRARADDRRLLFDRIPPESIHGSMEFVDYVLTDPSRLVFTANALLGPICDRLVGRGEHARSLRLTLPLANGETWTRTLRPARPTASRETWLRLIRGVLDRLTVPDAVAGMRLEMGGTEEAAVRQGDLFDHGFATAAAVEAAVARLAERQLHPVRPRTTAHPLIERRGGWTRSSLHPSPEGGTATTPPHHPSDPGPTRPPRLGDVGEAGSPTSPTSGGAEVGPGCGLGLQLLADPRRVIVESIRRRDHEVPVRMRDRSGWREVVLAAGPDRISGGQWEGAGYAREYYRCVTAEGVPLWVYRDALDGGWYLHGWWD